MNHVDGLLREGIAAVKAGQRAKARALLQKVLRQRPNDVNVWLWLSGAVETDDERRECLEKVLAIDPNNPHALKGVQKLGSRVTPAQKSPKPAPAATEKHPVSPAPSAENRRRLLEREIEWYAKHGWQLVFQSGSAFQVRKGKELGFVTIEQIEQRIAAASSTQQKKKPKRKLRTWQIILVAIFGSILLLFFVCLVIFALTPSSTPPSDGTPKPSSTPRPTWTKAPPRVKFLPGWKCYHDDIGNMIMEGTVRNTAGFDLRFVRLRGTAYDKSGNIVNTDWSYIDSDILYSDSTSTFTIYVDDPNDVAVKCGIELESYDIR